MMDEAMEHLENRQVSSVDKTHFQPYTNTCFLRPEFFN